MFRSISIGAVVGGVKVSHIAGNHGRNAENERSEAAVDEVELAKLVDFGILLANQRVAVVLGVVLIVRCLRRRKREI